MPGLRPAALLVAAAALLTGCSSIPGDRDPSGLGLSGDALPLRACLAPVTVALAPDEAPKEYEPRELIDEEELRAELATWLAPLFERTRLAAGVDRNEVLDDAWEQADQLLLDLALSDFRVEFQGHNGWWIPNIFNWLFWIVPSWWVATEEYTVSFDAELTVRSVDSLRPVHTERVAVSVEGTFDEFDRGWQLLGFIWPFNDADNWREVARRLLPAAGSALGEALARGLDEHLRATLARQAARDRMRKTVALVVGVSHYQDQDRLPPLPYAASDARAVADALVERCGLQPRHVFKLIGTAATAQRLQAVVARLAPRVNPGDQLLFYFGGYGTRGREGLPALLLQDAGAAQQGAFSLLKLGTLLAGVSAERLILLDCSFDGRGRSVAGPRGPNPKWPDAGLLAAKARGATILATGPERDLLTPEFLGASLFAHHLLRGLRGGADLDEDGEVSPHELFAAVRPPVRAEAAFFGKVQVPTAAGLDGPFVLHLVHETEPK